GSVDIGSGPDSAGMAERLVASTIFAGCTWSYTLATLAIGVILVSGAGWLPTVGRAALRFSSSRCALMRRRSARQSSTRCHAAPTKAKWVPTQTCAVVKENVVQR